MEKFIKYSWVLWIHIFLMVVGFLDYLFLDEQYVDGFFWTVVSIAWCIPPIFLLYCFSHTKTVDVLLVFSFFALNNLIDQLFFSTREVGINEIVFAIITITAILGHRCKTTKKKYTNNS